jgi:hypothetical protein
MVDQKPPLFVALASKGSVQICTYGRNALHPKHAPKKFPKPASRGRKKILIFNWIGWMAETEGFEPSIPLWGMLI